jgi:hypothetical protein
MEVVCSSETSFDIQRTTWRYIPEDCTLHNHRSENLKSYIEELFVRKSPPERQYISPEFGGAWHLNLC